MKNQENANVESQELALTVDGMTGFVADLTSTRTSMFCSLKATDDKSKAVLFKAMNNPEKRLGDCINMEINAKDLFCETVTCINKETGESNLCPRIVVIDDKGVGYQAVSIGVFSAMKKIIAVYGAPSWAKPIKLKVLQITKGDRKLLTFDVVC
jgi:hypothetical protein